MPAIYCDYAASTPVDPNVHQLMKTSPKVGNAASEHWYGAQAKQAIIEAKESIANLLKVAPETIVLTSGATESINMVLKGIFLQALCVQANLPHIVTSVIEHKATLEACQQLALMGCKITYLPVNKHGLIDLTALKAALLEQPTIVSLMHVNNEIGSIQPLVEVANLLRDKPCLFHVDGAQSIGKLSLDIQGLGIDYLSFSSHKLYGPQGIGALYVNPQARDYLQPLVSGGGQQQGLRSGTLPTSLAIGFGEACKQAIIQREKDWEHLVDSRAYLLKKLSMLPDIKLLGNESTTYPGILSLWIKGVHGAMLAGILNTQVACSTGSACASDFHEPSHVLKALKMEPQDLLSVIRLSIGRFSTVKEIIKVSNYLCMHIIGLRFCSPVWQIKEKASPQDFSVTVNHTIFRVLNVQCRMSKLHKITQIVISIFSAYGGWQLKTILEKELLYKSATILPQLTVEWLMEKANLTEKDYEIALLFEEAFHQLHQEWELVNE